jgi:hypothetical protein
MKVNTKDMRHKILNAVKRTPSSVNDDRLLISLIWLDEGWDYSKGLYANLRHVSSPETIRRTRQKLTEEGLLKPSEATTEARYKEFKQVRFII